MRRSKEMVIGFWSATGLFCLQTRFTAYAQLKLPEVAQAFAHLGYAVGTLVLWALSCFFCRSLEAT